MDSLIKFRKRETFFKGGQEIFYISGTRMPYLHTNTIAVSAYGELLWEPGTILALYHSYWAFTLVLEGGGFFREKGKAQEKIGPGDVYIARPSVDYTVGVRKDCVQKRRVILLNCSPLLTLLCSNGALADRNVIHTREPARFLRILENVRHLVTDGSTHLHEDLASLGYAFVHELIVQTAPAGVREGFELAARELEQNPGQEVSLEELAEKCNTSVRTLNRLFHEHFQCSPHEFLFQARMRNAAHLLQDDTFPVKGVAEACGYRNLSFFAKSFRQFYGVSPREYRSGKVVTEKVEKKHKAAGTDLPVREGRS